jgi:hypothetical protein
MADELKQEEKMAGAKKAMGTLLKVILGLAFLLLGVLAILRWRGDLLLVIKGCIGPFLLLVGVITLAIAKE